MPAPERWTTARGASLNGTLDIVRDSAENVRVIQGPNLDWTIVRYPRLMDGDQTRKYRVGYVGKEFGIRVSRADSILKELSEKKWLRKAPVVSY